MIRARDVALPAYFRHFIEEYFGDLGREWLAEIPALVARYAQMWELDVQPPFDGLTFNYVAPVRRSDGSPAVLKVGVPEPEQRSEILALQSFSGRGIVRLHASNLDDHIALIERLSPGAPLATHFPDRDEQATTIAAGLMADLALDAPAVDPGFSNLEGWFRGGLSGLRREFDGGVGPFPAALVERAETLSHELLASTERLALIHGDLHHTNILSSDAHGGWLAIDPKGLVGDRAYEPAPFILNPYEGIHTVSDAQALMARRIDQFAEILGIDRYRIHGWTLAFTVLSAWWSYGSSGNWRSTIALGEALAEV